jgi:hypothetical protein
VRASVVVVTLVVPIALACGTPEKPSQTATPPAVASSGTDAPSSPDLRGLTGVRATAIVLAATKWMTEHSEGACPSIAQLKADRVLEPMAEEKDAWVQPFTLECTDTEVVVASPGPDGKWKTADDLAARVAAPPVYVQTGATARSGLPSSMAADAGSGDVAAQTAVPIHACIQRAQRDEPGLAGHAALKLVIRADGTVKAVSVNRAKTDLKSPAVLGCILKEVSKMSFGASNGTDERTVEVP